MKQLLFLCTNNIKEWGLHILIEKKQIGGSYEILME